MQTRDHYMIDLLINCPRGHSELAPGNILAGEMLVEELCGQALGDLFETVWIEDVTITFVPGRAAPTTIEIRARSFEVLCPVENIDCAVEEKLSCVLAELVEALSVQRCAVVS